MSVSKKSMWGADTGNKTAAVPIGRNLLSDRDVLEAAGWRPRRHRHSLSYWLRLPFFPDAKRASRKECSHCDTTQLSNGNFLTKENLSVATCGSAAFPCDPAFSYTARDVQTCLVVGCSLDAAC